MSSLIPSFSIKENPIGIACTIVSLSLGGWLLVRAARSKGKDKSLEERSTTSSAGGGTLAYETKKAVDEYLLFHFGRPQDIFPYAQGPKEALDFAARCAQLCERHCQTLQDISGEMGETMALDVGCAVGGSSFELARSFQHVLGVDYSQAFVNAAESMRDLGTCDYTAQVEGDITKTCTASIPADIPRSRAKFIKGDACDLPKTLPLFDAVLAANLICRLPEPTLFLERLPSLVKPGGIAVLVSPHSWLTGWTPKNKWLGGFYREGAAVHTAEYLVKALEEDFDLVHREDMPFLIREHARKYQYGVSNAQVFRRKSK